MAVFWALWLHLSASLPAFAAIPAVSLSPGDVLLQPLDCRLCSMIEEEEESRFSHIGVVLEVFPEIRVAEAYGRVRAVGLGEFARKTERGQKILVLRFRNQALRERLAREAPRWNSWFSGEFEGAEYDAEFRWNNFDSRGREKFYCSELVTKMFQGFAGVEIGVKRMHFEKNREAWERFFRGRIPDGLPGNSPEDFRRSELFYAVGEI